MSIANIYSSTPNIIQTGIRDLSTRVVPPEPEAQPQHLPMFYAFTSRGDDGDFYTVEGTSMTNMYGDEFLNMGTKYATHATPFIRGITSQGNLVMLKRLKPAGASTAWVRFSLGVTKQTSGSNTKWLLRWIVNPTIPAGTDTSKLGAYEARYKESQFFGKGLTLAEVGLLTDDTQSLFSSTGIVTSGTQLERVYPIFDLEVSHFGEYGNNLGLSIYCPNKTSEDRPNLRFYDESFIRQYRVKFVKRKDKRSSAVTVSNKYGEQWTDFVFKPKTIDPTVGNLDRYLGTATLDNYRNLDRTNGRVPTYGPYNKVKVYSENIEHICKTLYQSELAADEAAIMARVAYQEQKQQDAAASGTKWVDDSAYKLEFHPRLDNTENEELEQNLHWQLDLFTARAMDGQPYRTIEIAGLRSEGELVNKESLYWADGGNDGVMNNEEYNRLVIQEIENFENDDCQYRDLARYPFSVFYDTGFMETASTPHKSKLVKLLAARKDISVCWTTHSVETNEKYIDNESVPGVTPLDKKDEAGMVSYLATVIRAVAESTIWGTGACRANIIMQCGTIVGSDFTGRVPMSYELAMKRARYMGSSDGKMRPGYGYDQDGIKQLQYMKEINNPFVPYQTREINWTNGASWAQFYDRNTMFFPAVRTIYQDETSVLVSDINMLIAVDLQKVCFRTWRRLVGNSKLTNRQFIELSDKYILEDVEGRYDGRVTIKPETYYTPADELRGYSWHCNIHMYANNMKTVGIFTVVTHRQEDLEG